MLMVIQASPLCRLPGFAHPKVGVTSTWVPIFFLPASCRGVLYSSTEACMFFKYNTECAVARHGPSSGPCGYDYWFVTSQLISLFVAQLHFSCASRYRDPTQPNARQTQSSTPMPWPR